MSPPASKPPPSKRYLTIGEASALVEVKPHVLRYWEQTFPQLRPVKRRGNRRYYQQTDIEVIRQIKALVQDQGFTTTGARQRLAASPQPLPASTPDLAAQLLTDLEDLHQTLS